jgi:hypothetical protein
MATSYIPGCYTTSGAPVPVPANVNDVIKPTVREGRTMPTPAKAAANVTAAIAQLKPQQGLL